MKNHAHHFFAMVGVCFPFIRFGFNGRLEFPVATGLLLPAPVPAMYFCPIVDGFIPPGLLIMFAHLGICLSATSGAYFLPQYGHYV